MPAAERVPAEAYMNGYDMRPSFGETDGAGATKYSARSFRPAICELRAAAMGARSG